MANTGFYNPDGYNPYDDALKGDWTDGEGNQRSQKDSQDQNESRDLLRDAENNALTGGSFYRGGNNTNQDSKSGNQKGNLSGLANKKGLAVIGIILLLVVGFGIFLGTTHSLLGPAISAKTLDMDTMNAAQEIEMTNTLAYLTSEEYGGELPEMLIEAFEANGIQVGEDKKSLYYNGENISGSNLSNAMENNVGARSAVYKTTLGQIANTLDETAINIDNNRGISKNLFVDAEQSNNIEKDLEELDKIANPKFESQLSTYTYTQNENLEYKTKSLGKDDQGNEKWCYVDKDGNCVGGTENNHDLCRQEDDTHDDCVLKNHRADTATASASTTAQTKGEAEDQASSYIEKVSTRVTKISSWGCTSLRLGQLLSTTAAANEQQQSVQTYAVVMENISKMMAGDGAQSLYHAVMTKLIDEGTIEVADYANATVNPGSKVEDLTVDIGTKQITGSAVTSPSLLAKLTDSSVSADDITNFSYERTNTVLNASLGTHSVTTEQCNISQRADSEKQSGGILSLFIQGKIADLITKGTSIAVSTNRGSGATTTSGGLAWTGTKTISGVLGTFIKKFFVNVNVNSYIQFMSPAFGETSYANANAVYSNVELGEAIVRGGYDYFSVLGRSGSGQSGADTEVAVSYNKATKSVLARQAEVDRYERSPFDISSPNTFLGSIAYSFLPLTTTNTVTSINSLVRNTGSSIASLSGVASAANSDDYMISNDSQCDRLSDIKAATTKHCSLSTVTDPSVLGLDYNDQTYTDVINASLDENGEIKDGSPLARYISYGAKRLSPAGILDENISEELDENKTILQRIAQRFKSIFGFLTATYTDEESGMVDYSSFVASESNKEWQDTFKYCSLWMLRQRQLIQLGVVEYDKSPMISYIKKYEEAHQPKDYTDYIAKISGISYNNAQLVLDTIAYYTFLDEYDAETRIAMEEGITSVFTSEEAIAKISSEDQRLGSGDKDTPIIPLTQEIIYDDIRNRSYVA